MKDPASRVAIHRPPGIGLFQFVVLAKLRAAQLKRGCLPRVDGVHKATVIAQLEIATGKVVQLVTLPDAINLPVTTDGAIASMLVPMSAIDV